MPIQDNPVDDADKLEQLAISDQHPLTSVVTQNIVGYCADRMAYMIRKHKIIREISCMIYGQTNPDESIDDATPKQSISMETYERIRNGARALMRQRSIVGQQEAKEDSIGCWEQMIADPDVPWAVKARARENMDKIHRVMPLDVSLNVIAPVKETVSLADLGLDLESRKKALETLRMRKALVTANDATQAAGEVALTRQMDVEMI